MAGFCTTGGRTICPPSLNNKRNHNKILHIFYIKFSHFFLTEMQVSESRLKIVIIIKRHIQTNVYTNFKLHRIDKAL